jgi:DNA-binding LacI/PurR family transcriptional regulator
MDTSGRRKQPPSPSSRVTGRDVARRAGVSLATVSLALSERFQDGHRVADATRERVLVAARELGYTPNHIAQSLRQRRTAILAMVVPSLANPYYTEIFEGCRQVALGRGYSLTVMEAPDPRARGQAIRLLQGGAVDGVVVAHHADELVSELRRLRRQGVQAVTVQGRSPDPGIPAVRVDTRESAHLATGHLIRLGHRRIGHLTVLPIEPEVADDESAPLSSLRLVGYRRALTEAGLAYDPDLVVVGDDTVDLTVAGAQAARELLRRPGPPATAIFAYNDMLAIGAIRELLDAGLRVPEDVAVIGHDGIRLGAFTNPGLSTVAHHCLTQGRLAMETLCDLLEGAAPGDREQRLEPELVVRESCGGSG